MRLLRAEAAIKLKNEDIAAREQLLNLKMIGHLWSWSPNTIVSQANRMSSILGKCGVANLSLGKTPSNFPCDRAERGKPTRRSPRSMTIAAKNYTGQPIFLS